MSILDKMWDVNNHRVGPLTVPEGADVTRHEELAVKLSVRLERLASFAGRFSVGLPVRSLDLQVDDIIAYGVETWSSKPGNNYAKEQIFGGSNYILPDGRKVMAQRQITPYFPREADPEKLKARVSENNELPEFYIKSARALGTFDSSSFDLSIRGANLLIHADKDSGFELPGYPTITDKITSPEGLTIVNPVLKIDAMDLSNDKDTDRATFRDVVTPFSM